MYTFVKSYLIGIHYLKHEMSLVYLILEIDDIYFMANFIEKPKFLQKVSISTSRPNTNRFNCQLYKENQFNSVIILISNLFASKIKMGIHK